MEDFTHPSGRVTGMANTNKLVRFYEPCDAGKTGSTVEAGFCLSATAKKGDLRLISVVLGADTGKHRFADATKQFEWGFANFQATKLVSEKDNFAGQISVQKAKTQNFEVSPEKDFVVTTKKGEKSNFEIKVNDFKVKAPQKQGNVVGQIEVFEDGQKLDTIKLVLKQDVSAKTFFDTFKTTLRKW